MKVLLIAPPSERIRYNISGVYPMPPLGLCYLGAYLELEGHKIEILDMPASGTPVRDVPQITEGKGYGLIGISATIFSFKQAKAISDSLRLSGSKIPVALGGPCTTFPAESLLKHAPSIDYAITGEGEEALLDLVRSLVTGKDISAIPSVTSRCSTSITNESKDLRRFLDMDRLPLPARHLLPEFKYRMHPPFGLGTPFTLVETSRGCSYRCSFCTLSKELRERSASNVFEEISNLVTGGSMKEIHFVDPTFTYNRSRVKELCDSISKEGIDFLWTCKTRTDQVDMELLGSMAKAGCYMISYGVESGSKRMLQKLDKNLDPSASIKAISQTRKNGIKTLVYVLIGSPGEDETSVSETTALIKESKPDFVLFGELMADPSSAISKDMTASQSFVWSDIENFYLDGKPSRLDRVSITGMNRKTLHKWIKSSYVSFYLNPGYFYRTLTRARGLRDIINLARGALFLARDMISGARSFSVGIGRGND